MCRCFWRYTLGWGLKFKEIKPQIPKYWVLGGRTSLPRSLVKNLLSQVVLDSRNLSSRWQVVSFFFFQTFSEFHFLIMEKHLETQKPGQTSRCFSKCYAFTDPRCESHARNPLVSTIACFGQDGWAGSRGKVRHAFLEFFSGRAMGHHHWHQCPIAFGGFIMMAIFLCYGYYWYYCRLITKPQEIPALHASFWYRT